MEAALKVARWLLGLSEGRLLTLDGNGNGNGNGYGNGNGNG